MADHKKNNAKKNAVIGLFNQIVILALGLVIPRLVLVNYGSEANGLITTVAQIFTYVALLEAGIGNAAVNAFYKPIVNKDVAGISEVFAATKKYFRRVTGIYAICVVALTFVYPFFVTSEMNYTTIAWVIFLQGMTGVITFYFSAAYRQLLIADGKYFIVSTANLMVYVLSSVGKIVLMGMGFDIVALQWLHLVVNCAQVIMIVAVARRKYNQLREVENPDISLLSERNAFVVHEVSGTIFSSTDAFVLTTFCDLKIASVYTVYNMVFHSLSNMISAVNSSLDYILGHVYAKGNRESYIKIHDIYDSVYQAVAFSIFTVAYILVLPFVKLYTAGVTDIQYMDALLPLLFALLQLLYSSKTVAARLIMIAGHAEATRKNGMIEAAINLGSSIILVNFFGIYGVLLGTILALLYRSNDVIIYANTKVLRRSPIGTYKKMFTNLFVFAGIVVAEHFFREPLIGNCSNYLAFGLYGVGFTILSVILYAIVALFVDSKLRLLVIRKVLKRDW